MRIHEAGAELDELRVHRVVHAGGETLVVRTCALERTVLLVVVQTDIIGIVLTATAQVHVVVLADTRLKHLVKPVGIRAVLELIHAIRHLAVATRQRGARVGTSLSQIGAVLIGVHHVIYTARNLVHTEVTLVVHLQRLVLLTVLRGDDHHTVSGTRTVDGTCRCVLQHLDRFDIVRREVADRRTHGHTVDHIQRSAAAERSHTTDTHRRVSTRLTVGGNLHTSHLTFEHRRDVRVRGALQFVGIHDRHRTCQVGLLLSTVTHHDYLIQHHGV